MNFTASKRHIRDLVSRTPAGGQAISFSPPANIVGFCVSQTLRLFPSCKRHRATGPGELVGQGDDSGVLVPREVIPSPVVIDSHVMHGLGPGIQTFAFGVWMAGSSPAMTIGSRWVILFETWYKCAQPSAERRLAPGKRRRNNPGAVDRHLAKITIASSVLKVQHKAEPRGKVASTRECLGVPIVFISHLDVGPHIFRRHKPDPVTLHLQLHRLPDKFYRVVERFLTLNSFPIRRVKHFLRKVLSGNCIRRDLSLACGIVRTLAGT